MRNLIKAHTISFVLLVALPALAEPGDKQFIDGDNVNIRSGPGTGHAVVIQLNRGHELMEFGRDGEWVNVGVTDTGGKDGWVHSSLISPTRTAATAAPKSSAKFATFKSAVEQLNSNVRARAGVDFFTRVQDHGDGIVSVTATETWLGAPRSDRESNLQSLFNLWDAADGTGLPIMVQVRDAAGTVRMKKARR